MANTFKKIIKKHKKKKLQAERNRKAKARERAEEEYADDYERRLSRHKRSVVKKTVITVVAIAAAVTAVGFYIEKRSYHTYKVVQTSRRILFLQIMLKWMEISFDTVRTGFPLFLIR